MAIKGAVVGFAFSPTTLAVAYSHQIALWDPNTGRCLATLPRPSEPLTSLAWHPNARQLAIAAESGTITLWNTDSQTAAQSIPTRHNSTQIQFQPTSHRLATLTHTAIRLWDPATGNLLLDHLAPHIRSLAFSPDGLLAATAEGPDIALWDTRTGAPHPPGFDPVGSDVSTLAWSPAANLLASVSEDRTLRLWDPAHSAPTNIIPNATCWAACLAWHPDGSLLASSYHGVIHIWRPGHPAPVRTLPSQKRPIQALAWSPDGQILAAAGGDPDVNLWSPHTGQLLRTLPKPPRPVPPPTPWQSIAEADFRVEMTTLDAIEDPEPTRENVYDLITGDFLESECFWRTSTGALVGRVRKYGYRGEHQWTFAIVSHNTLK